MTGWSVDVIVEFSRAILRRVFNSLPDFIDLVFWGFLAALLFSTVPDSLEEALLHDRKGLGRWDGRIDRGVLPFPRCR